MCLAVPMKIEEIVGPKARCRAMGQERWADLTLIADIPPAIGDYVQISSGYARSVVSESDALEAYKLFDEILSVISDE